jgi:hypothetical protein
VPSDSEYLFLGRVVFKSDAVLFLGFLVEGELKSTRAHNLASFRRCDSAERLKNSDQIAFLLDTRVNNVSHTDIQ